MYIVYEKAMTYITTYFALTEEQLADERSRVLFDGGEVKEIARVATVKDMKNLSTKTRISYINKKGEIKFA